MINVRDCLKEQTLLAARAGESVSSSFILHLCSYGSTTTIRQEAL